jgi:EF hand
VRDSHSFCLGRRVLFLMSVAGLLGCVKSDALTMPTYTPKKAAETAMADYDTNRDGFLDAKELERCPALKHSLDVIDKNGDHKLSLEELEARIQDYQESQVALKAVGCHVTLDGKPLVGATVTYIPEKFMGSSTRSATGVSDERGAVALITEGEQLSGVQPGFYRVQISKKNASGQETIPARYNQDTTLGLEVSPRMNRKPGAKMDDSGNFRLTSRSK